MALDFTNEELDVLISLSAPLDPDARALFMTEVSEALANVNERGAGVVFRTARPIQRKYWTPPRLTAEPARA